MAGKKTTNSGKPKAKGAPSSEGQQNRFVFAVSTKSVVSATVDTLDGPLGQNAPVVPPAPNEKDFTDDKSFLLAKSAWFTARADHNRHKALFHERHGRRHREWFSSDIQKAAVLKAKAAEVTVAEATDEVPVEDLVNQAVKDIEKKKAEEKN
ncbi:hypothetical protein ACHAPM_002888 [Fusarium culmorum]